MSSKEHVEAAEEESPTLKKKVIVGEKREGWLEFWEEMEKHGNAFARPVGEDRRITTTSCCFISRPDNRNALRWLHKFCVPLGHIVTAVYWHNADPEACILPWRTPAGQKAHGESSMGSGWRKPVSSFMIWINLFRTSC